MKLSNDGAVAARKDDRERDALRFGNEMVL
jgi:hypothetical protein